MVALWSTTRVCGKPIEDYSIEKNNVETHLAEMTEFIVDNIGATEYGPAASFRDIVRAIVKNTDEILSVDIPMEFSSLSELTYVSVPVRMGWTLGPTLYSFLNDIEKQRLENAAMMIRQIYGDAINSLRDA
jgi:malate/lactate dehydrogenase